MSYMDPTDRALDTDSVHAGQHVDPATGSRATPIHQTTSYLFESADEAAARYTLESQGDLYSRISNPTVRVLEDRLARLHGAGGAVATASGMAAIDALTFVLTRQGQHIVSSTDIYGGTATYFRHAAEKRGVPTRFVNPLDLTAVKEAVDADTAFVHVETIGNPSLVTPDFEALAEIAHDVNAPLVVDNTFASPSLCRPFEHGADIVWESTTKWIHGSGTTIGGVVCDAGTFDWSETKFPELAGANRAYPHLDFSDAFPEAPLAAAVRYRSVRTLGGAQSPFNAWQTLQGLETLPLRMRKHSDNADIVARFLADHPEVAWVTYPGLNDHRTHEFANRYLDGGYGGMLTFGLEGGYTASKRVCEETELISFLANVGDAKTLIIHPASTTHSQLSPEEQAASGVQTDLLRLSVGIEDPEDIIADLDRAIRRASTA